MVPRAIVLALLLAACGSKDPSKAPDTAEGAGDATAAADDDGDGGNVDPPGTTDAAPAAAATEHALWYLAPNRLLAHRTVDGDLVVDAGSPGFARYTRFGLPVQRWKLGVLVDGVPTAAPDRGASLELPLTADPASAARPLLLRVHARAAARLTLKVNGRGLGAQGRVALVPGWQVVGVDTAGRWTTGENLVVLESDRGDNLHVRWLRVASVEAAGQVPDDPAASPRSPAHGDPLAAAAWDAAAGGFRLTTGAGLARYVRVPDSAVLVADLDGACQLEVTARDGAATMAGARLTGAGARLELAALAGKIVRLEVIARDCAAGLLRDARVVVPGPPPPPVPAGAPPRYIIYWVMDALRADRIPTFQPGARAETPNFDRLATDGAVFRRHYVGGLESQGSHASMFTSLYPGNHQVLTAGPRENFKIGKRWQTLGTLMREAGFHTIGVTGNGFVGVSGGFTRGFDEFRNMMQEKGVANGVIYGAKILDDVLRRLDKQRQAGKPAFVFMGTIDTHSPLRARPPWIDRYSPDYQGPMQRGTSADVIGLIKGRMGCHKIPPDVEIQRMRAIYDSAISYQDALLGDLLAALDKMGIADETMIVITADHGEELFEEDRCGHGVSLRDSITRVPFIVHYPRRVATAVIDEGSEGVDLLPTLLDVLDAPPLPQAQGESLRARASGVGQGWARPAIASKYELSFAMSLGGWKARVGRTGTPVLFDLVGDPLERKDLARSHPVERRYLTDHLGMYLAHRGAWKKGRWGAVSNMTEDAIADLEAPPP